MDKKVAGAGGVLVIILFIIATLLGIDPNEILGDVNGETNNGSNSVDDGGFVITEAGGESAAEGEWYEIYFTNPTCPPEEERFDGVDEIIAEDIRQAERSLDIAAFELNSEPITEALMALEDAGIPVRVVIDEDAEDESAIRRLRNNGTSVVTDDRSALMHNKFIIIDEQVVWMGSMNFTTNGVHCNNNNVVRLQSEQLAANYIVEMNEMYDDREFGPRSPENTPAERLTIGGIQVENYFAPEKKLAPIISRFIARANEEILFMAFSFTHDDIGGAMIERAEGGVTVQGVFEKTGSDTEYSYFPVLNKLDMDNVQVRVDGNGRIMHHKVIIVDREAILFGSFNFSANANRNNDENVVIINDPTFVSFFVEEFGFVWDEAEVR